MKEPADDPRTSLAIAIGMLGGAAVGAVIWLTTETFVFFPVFIGAGLAVGLAFAQATRR